jgi:GxxExxY protein
MLAGAVVSNPSDAARGPSSLCKDSAARRKDNETADERSGLNALSEQIIRCAFVVSNTLGSGFLEKVYENTLAHELRKMGLAVAQQRGIVVTYDGIVVGEHAVELLVEEAVLVELKAVKAFDDIH